MNLQTLITYLETILNRTTIDCKNYDKTTIAYTGEEPLTLTVNSETISENIRQLILYPSSNGVLLIAQTLHLTNYPIGIADITTIEVT